ncbi:hypothetical protein DN406_27405 [Bacillus sp. BB56-3]|nr:hypothetical protein DN406_27405 [Bacillus sp. BB56-3]
MKAIVIYIKEIQETKVIIGIMKHVKTSLSIPFSSLIFSIIFFIFFSFVYFFKLFFYLYVLFFEVSIQNM